MGSALFIDGDEGIEFGVELADATKMRLNQLDYGKLTLANPRRHLPRRKVQHFIHGFLGTRSLAQLTCV